MKNVFKRCVSALVLVGAFSSVQAGDLTELDDYKFGVQVDALDIVGTGFSGFGTWVLAKNGKNKFHLATGTYTNQEIVNDGSRRDPEHNYVEDREYIRVGYSRYVWSGLFVGAHTAVVKRKISHKNSSEKYNKYAQTIAPLVGYDFTFYDSFSFTTWIAPRIFLQEPDDVTLDGAGETYKGTKIESSLGFNLGYWF